MKDMIDLFQMGRLISNEENVDEWVRDYGTDVQGTPLISLKVMYSSMIQRTINNMIKSERLYYRWNSYCRRNFNFEDRTVILNDIVHEIIAAGPLNGLEE